MEQEWLFDTQRDPEPEGSPEVEMMDDELVPPEASDRMVTRSPTTLPGGLLHLFGWVGGLLVVVVAMLLALSGIGLGLLLSE